MHNSSLENMKKFVVEYLTDYQSKKITILDIGSQDFNGGYRSYFNNPNWKYLGVDMVKGNNVDIVPQSIYNWVEIKSNFADVVVSGQALEHIGNVWRTMSEIGRVLKYGGIGCIIVPSSGPEHKSPIDCWRFFPDGMVALLTYAGLDVLDAYNCWNNPPVDGEDNLWKDTVVVFTKKRKGIIKTIRIKLRNYFLRFV